MVKRLAKISKKNLKIADLRRAVYKAKPALAEIMEQYGSLSVNDYFCLRLDKIVRQKITYPLKRRQEFINAVSQEAVRILGARVGARAAKHLQNFYAVSTADHHGPIIHPFFVNSILAQSLAARARRHDSVVVLACGNVSLNNSSFPRGIFWHLPLPNLPEERWHLVSWRHRCHPVFAFGPYQPAGVTKLQNKMIKHARQLQPTALKRLHDVWQIYNEKKLWSFLTYAEQITRTNYHLWQRVPGEQHTHLIYLQLEDIVTRLFLQHHLRHKTIIHSLVFDQHGRQLFARYFNGIIGAFSLPKRLPTQRKGTFLFWAIQNGCRQALWEKNGTLVTADGKYRLPLTSAAVVKAMRQKEIIPSMALSLVLVAFYYGVQCGGGFSQVDYLTKMKRAYLRILQKMGGAGWQEEARRVRSVETKWFCGEFIMTLLGNSKQIVPATSVDLILYSSRRTEQLIRKHAKSISLQTAVDAMLPELHKIIFGTRPYTALPKNFRNKICIYV